MEDGRIGGFGRAVGDGVLGHWGQLAAEARAAAARNGCGPPGGTARERSRLVRALTQARILRQTPDDATVRLDTIMYTTKRLWQYFSLQLLIIH